MSTRVKTWLRQFKDDEEGGIAIETVLIIPALFWAYLAMFAIFDAYRQHSINQKAAYTLGDIVSRETTPITNAYISGARDLLAYMTYAKQENAAVRVSSVSYDADADAYLLDWSEVRGWVPRLSGAQVRDWHDRLPVMTDNERITVVETWVKYEPPFKVGMSRREIRNFIFTRPRYAPQVLFDAAS